MTVISMQLAAIQTEVLLVCAILDTQAMERFVKVQVSLYMNEQLFELTNYYMGVQLEVQF